MEKLARSGYGAYMRTQPEQSVGDGLTLSARVGLEILGCLRRRNGRWPSTQAQLGEVLGLSQSAMSRRLSGEVPLDVAELSAIAAALDVSPARLMGDLAMAVPELPRRDSNTEPAELVIAIAA